MLSDSLDCCDFGEVQTERGEEPGKVSQETARAKSHRGKGKNTQLPFVLRTFVAAGERKQSRGAGVAEAQSLSPRK